MGKKVVDKGLVFVIIMLFVGAGVTPCLTNFTVEASDGNSNFGFDSCIECGCGDNNNTTNSPTNLLTESTIKYYQSVGSQCFGLSDGGTSQLAMRITPKELSTYSGWSLKAGRFYHCSSNSCTGYLKIYSKGTSTSPGSLLAQKRYSNKFCKRLVSATYLPFYRYSFPEWSGCRACFQSSIPHCVLGRCL